MEWYVKADLRQNENLEIFTCEMDQGIEFMILII